MAAESRMAALGTSAPDFRLPSFEGGTVARDDFEDAPALLVMFLCPHCPFVRHVREELARLCEGYQRRGVGVVAINPNDTEQHPEDGPEGMAEEARAAGYTFPYLIDGTQEVASAHGAACTPDFFLFDGDGRLAYRGQMDGSRPGNGVPVTGDDLTAAVTAVLEGKPVPEVQYPSAGCSIKWREAGS